MYAPLQKQSKATAKTSSQSLARTNRQAVYQPEHLTADLQNPRENQTATKTAHAGPGGAGVRPAFRYNFANIPVFHRPVKGLQAKLTVNVPGDAHEQEADRVAEQVMRMPDPQAAPTLQVSDHAAGVQRECACGGSCDDCKKENHNEDHAKVQMKAAGPVNAGGMEAPPIVHEVLRSSGQPLDATTRAFMEPRLEHDFSQVRVHTDEKAAESARAVGARAYTVGSSVVFGTGEFVPGSRAGQRLLGHELTHVVQQQVGLRGLVQRQPSTIPAPPLGEVVEEALHGPGEYRPPLNIIDSVLKDRDRELKGPEGELFKQRVEEAAAKVGLDPGLLAASLLAEWSRDDAYTKKSGEENTAKVGADDYLEKENEIRKRIPAAQSVKVRDAGTLPNERGRTIRRGKFDATKAVLVGAIYLKHGELKVRDILSKHGVDFETLTPELRFALTRLAMNPGKENIESQIERFLLSRDIADTAPGILIRTGVRKQDARKPQSGATLVAAQGLHLSQKVFGNIYQPSSQSLVPPKETPLRSRIELED